MSQIIQHRLQHFRLPILVPPHTVRVRHPKIPIRLTSAQVIVGMVQDFVITQILGCMVGITAQGRQNHIARLRLKHTAKAIRHAFFNKAVLRRVFIHITAHRIG